MVNSVDKLRTLPRHGTNGFGAVVTASEETIEAIADEIEAEIAERYLPAPLDADGMPVRIGDKMVSNPGVVRTVKVLKLDESHSWQYGKNAAFLFSVEQSHHVKPRTLEDVLREMVGMTDQPLCEEDVKAFADEIRELPTADGDCKEWTRAPGRKPMFSPEVERMLYEKRMRGDWS